MAQTKLREGQTVGTAANAIINGDCSVNQRVTAYTLVKDAYCWDSSDLYGPDRFEGMATGTLVSAGTFGQTTSANCGVSGTAFKFAGVTLTGTGILYLRYRMEAKDAKKFKNQTASFKCKAYQDTGGAIDHTIYIRKADVANVFSAVTAISNSGAVSIPNITETALPYAAIAMGDCSNGIEIEIKIAAGAITTKNFEITECKFEIGSTSTAFEYEDYSDTLSKCHAFFDKGYWIYNAVATASTQDFRQSVLFHSVMWGTPTIAKTSTDFQNCSDIQTVISADGFYNAVRSTAAGNLYGYFNFTAAKEL